MERMSPRQKEKVNENIIANLDTYLESQQFRAVSADARMFGLEAVLQEDYEK